MHYLQPVNQSDPDNSPRWSQGWRDAAWVLRLFAVSRLLLVALVVYSRQTITRGPHVVVSTQMEHGGTLLDIFTQWDGSWYRIIAQHGYAPPMTEFATAFFPVYPLLVRVAAFIVRDLQIASLLVSNGCLIASWLLLLRLLRLDYDDLICRRALIFLAFNPTAFFHSAAYSESTFLLLSVGALLTARRARWFFAGVCAGCLSATRAPGLLIGVPLLVEHAVQWRARGAGWRQFFRPQLLWLALVPAGLAVFMFSMYLQRGDFFGPMHAQAAGWKKALTTPWQTFLWPDNFPPSHIPLYQAISGSAVILTGVGFFLRVRATYLSYAVLALLFYLSWGSLEGLPRYVSVLFPIHLILALISTRWKWMYEPLLAFSIALLALCAILFANAYQMT